MRERAVDILAIVANLRLDRSPIASLSVFLAYFLFRRSAADHRALRGPCVKARSQLRMNWTELNSSSRTAASQLHDCDARDHTHTHTHTHPFNGPLSGTTRVSRYQKGKPGLDFTEARDSEWQWHPLGHTQVCTSLQTDNHASTPLTYVTTKCQIPLHGPDRTQFNALSELSETRAHSTDLSETRVGDSLFGSV